MLKINLRVAYKFTSLQELHKITTARQLQTISNSAETQISKKDSVLQ